MAIIVDLDVQLAKRKLSVAEFAAAVGISPANVAVLKNGRAKAVRFTTLDAICRTLDCQPGDVLRWVPDDADAGEAVVVAAAAAAAAAVDHRPSDRFADRAG
ncbi:helix-turn-helix domain-containing protein [Streptomyces sp. NPDC059949]|uniref:helix-turn-helix domain-containing protein n=1 Tax=Streptomyces sp. NPDC059949 TaxID=3347013 RepID=UPI00364F380D